MGGTSPESRSDPSRGGARGRWIGSGGLLDILQIDMFEPCSKQGCVLPGIFKFEFVDDNGPLVAFLCPRCFLEAPALLREIAEVKKEPFRIEQDVEKGAE